MVNKIKDKLNVKSKMPNGKQNSIDIEIKEGTLTVLEGANGIGKSTILTGLALAFGDKSIKDIPYDSEVTISSNGNSVTIKDGVSLAKTFRIPFLSSSVFNNIVKPNYKTKEARNKNRCLAIYGEIQINEVKSKEFISSIFDDENDIKLVCEFLENKFGSRYSISYLDFIKSFKSCLENKKRDLKKKIESNESNIGYCKRDLEDLVQSPITKESILSKIDHLSKSIKEIEVEDENEVRGEIALKNSLIKQSEDILESFGDLSYTKEDVENLSKEYSEIKLGINDIENKIISLEKEKSTLLERKSNVQEEGKRALEFIKVKSKVFDRESERKHIKELEKSIEDIRNNEIAKESLSKIETRYKEIVSSEEELVSFRFDIELITKTISENLSSDMDLSKFGLDGVRILDGDVSLVDEETGEIKHIDDMSEGEQVKAAFDISCMFSKGNFLRVDRSLISSLQPKNFEAVLKEISDRSIIAFTEKPSDSEEIKVKVYTKKD